MAAREWRRVQEERPSCSTSGGQSFDGREEEVEREVMPFLAEVKEARELQVRQLGVLEECGLKVVGSELTVCRLSPESFPLGVSLEERW